MSGIFGPGPFDVALGPPAADPQRELDDVVARLRATRPGDPGMISLTRATPTAAFSRRDTLLPGYTAARTVVSSLGFTPVIRPVGGHLAVYDEGSLLLHAWGPHEDPRADIQARFVALGEALAAALRGVGVDARLGPVPGEYCDGRYSVNAGGTTKLVGTGQRIVRGGFLFSAVVIVQAGPALAAALRSAYRLLDLDLDPNSVGGVSDGRPDLTLDVVGAHLLGALAPLLPGAVVPRALSTHQQPSPRHASRSADPGLARDGGGQGVDGTLYVGGGGPAAEAEPDGAGGVRR